MRKEYVLLLLVAVLLPGTAAIDPWFEDLCRSYLVDSPSDETGTDRIHGETCVQTFPYKGTHEHHETFCRSTFPFEFTMKRTDDQVTCIWEYPAVQCNSARKEHLTIRQINSKCYTTAECHLEGYELARPTSADEIRWIARLYRNQYEALIIDQGKSIKVMKDVGYTEGFIHKTKKENLMNVALIFSRLAIFGVYPGNAVREIPNAQRNATKLCMVPVLIDGNVQSVASMPTTTRNLPSSTEQHKERQQIGSGSAYTKFPLKIGGFHFGTAFITRNDYQPVFTTDGLVDIDHFHSQCARICHQCFAATYEIFLSYKNSMPYGRFWIPGQRKDALSPCGGAFDIQNRKNFRVKNNPGSHIPHIPANKNWFGGSKDSHMLPGYSCADQERIAVQLIHTEQYTTYVDVPAFDRLPIVCVSGQTVSEPTGEGECFRNSEMRNGKCECKNGFQDALKVNELKMRAEQLGFHKNGQICVKPQSCKDVVVTTKQKFTSYLILVDGSASIGSDNYKDNVAPFVYKLKNVIPQSASFILYQYGSGTAAKWAWRSKGWTSADFDSAYKEAIAEYLDSGTKTYTNMNRLIELSERYDEIGKKYMIVITDGATWDFSQAIADRRVKNQINIVYITVGNSVDDHIRKTEGGNAFELYGVSNFGGLTDALVTQVTKNICDEWPEGHVEKVVYGDDWDKA